MFVKLIFTIKWEFIASKWHFYDSYTSTNILVVMLNVPKNVATITCKINFFSTKYAYHEDKRFFFMRWQINGRLQNVKQVASASNFQGFCVQDMENSQYLAFQIRIFTSNQGWMNYHPFSHETWSGIKCIQITHKSFIAGTLRKKTISKNYNTPGNLYTL